MIFLSDFLCLLLELPQHFTQIFCMYVHNFEKGYFVCLSPFLLTDCWSLKATKHAVKSSTWLDNKVWTVSYKLTLRFWKYKMKIW